jgi:hypothetical protein|tara:strand:+ start:188 stop:397 length:210 start_codon:yes stop_codon:yes gene_type:complete
MEKRMEKKNSQEVVADRRGFLKGSAVSVAAAGVAVVAGKSAVANEVDVTSGAGYRETEHVKTYYETARF